MSRNARSIADGQAGGATRAAVENYVAHVRIFRRLLWRRIAIVAGLFLVAAWLLSLSRAAVGLGLLVPAAVAGWALWFEWRARRRLDRLVGESRDSQAPHGIL